MTLPFGVCIIKKFAPTTPDRATLIAMATSPTLKHDILHGNINRILIRIAYPTIIALLVNNVVSFFIDRLFLASLGETALASIGQVYVVQSYIISLGMGFAIGLTGLFSRLFGARRHALAHNFANRLFMLVAILYTLIMVTGFAFRGQIFDILGVNQDTLGNVDFYYTVLLCGSFTILIPPVFNSYLNAQGDTKRTMLSTLCAVGANLILDPILIFGLPAIGSFAGLPGFGFHGAAFANVGSRLFSSAVSVFFVLRMFRINWSFTKLRYTRMLFAETFRVGMPNVFTNLLFSIILTVMFSQIKQFGQAAIAAYTMGLTYSQMINMPIGGYTRAILSVTGQNFGARQFSRVKQIVRISFTNAMIFTLILSTMFVIFGRELSSIFLHSNESIAMGVYILLFYALSYPFATLNNTIQSVLNALALNSATMIARAFQLVVIPCVIILSRYYGFDGVMIGQLVGSITVTIVSVLLLSLSWHKKLPIAQLATAKS